MAKLSTRKKPHMSVTVVRRGPDTSAGSRPQALEGQGQQPPQRDGEDGVGGQRAADHEPQIGVALPEQGEAPQQASQDEPVHEPETALLEQDAQDFVRSHEAERQLPHAHGNRLVARASAHVADHRQEDRQRDGCGEGVLVDRDHARGHDVQHDVDAEPREAPAGAHGERHGAELLAADDAAQVEELAIGPLAHRLLDRSGQDHADQETCGVHDGHPVELVLDEEARQLLDPHLNLHPERVADHQRAQRCAARREEEVAHAQDAHQRAAGVQHVEVLHVVAGVPLAVALEVFGHVGHGLVVAVGEVLGDHHPARRVRRVGEQLPHPARLLVRHAKQDRLGLLVFELAQQICLEVARQLLHDRRRLLRGEVLDEVDRLRFRDLPDHPGGVRGIQECEQSAPILLGQTRDRARRLGRADPLQEGLQRAGIARLEDLRELLPGAG